MTMKWTLYRPATPEHLGYVPRVFTLADPRPAREQIATRYAHGGGWNPFEGFTLDLGNGLLTFPGDPPYRLLAETRLREERLLFFELSWLVVVQPDGTWAATRMD